MFCFVLQCVFYVSAIFSSVATQSHHFTVYILSVYSATAYVILDLFDLSINDCALYLLMHIDTRFRNDYGHWIVHKLKNYSDNRMKQEY